MFSNCLSSATHETVGCCFGLIVLFLNPFYLEVHGVQKSLDR